MATGLKLYDEQGRVVLDSADRITRQVYAVTATLNINPDNKRGTLPIPAGVPLKFSSVIPGIISVSGSPMVQVGATLDTTGRQIVWTANVYYSPTVVVIFQVFAYG